MDKSFYNFLERQQKIILFIFDIIFVVLAMVLSYYIFNRWYKVDILNGLFASWSTYLGIGSFIFFFWLFKLYKYTWRYADFDVMISIIASCCLGTLFFGFFKYIEGWEVLKLVLFFILVLSVVFIGFIRLLARQFSKKKHVSLISIPKSAIKNLIMVGSHEECALLVKSIRSNPELAYYNVVGIVDYDKSHKNKYVGNIRVLGDCENLVHIVEKNNIQEVLFILDDDFDGEKIKSYVLELRKKKIPVKTFDKFSDRIAQKKIVNLKDIDVEDLLHRPSRKIDLKVYSDYVKDKVVMVTGGGGSIGSEIVRQVAALEPKQLIIMGHGENSIFTIYHEIKEIFPELNIYPVIASIADRERIFNVFEQFKPNVLFHAAAHKHVPLMEMNIHEAVRNNILGTLNLADACYKYKVNTMVQISTDKAANPSSVMGATKFVCEQIVKSTAAREGNETKFVIVRFGNVLGSRGSVIPVFLRQIQNGGPVTVTDPGMTRFFMIIPEACRLVVTAGSIGDNGKIYVLDMGKPVKIMDLAEDVISICGYTPGEDMKIKISGIRPGEKLHEVLSSETEKLVPTDFNGINMVASSEVVSYDELCKHINELNTLEKTKDAKTFIEEVCKLKK